jgi:hypothetical protein
MRILSARKKPPSHAQDCPQRRGTCQPRSDKTTERPNRLTPVPGAGEPIPVALLNRWKVFCEVSDDRVTDAWRQGKEQEFLS